MSIDETDDAAQGGRQPRLSWMELQGLLQNPIAFHRIFATIGGGAMPGLFLSQCFYWTRITSDPEGWFYKSGKDWTKETALTRTEQETCRKKLIARGLLETDNRGVPATLHFRLNQYQVLLAVESALAAGISNAAPQFVEKLQTQFAENLQTQFAGNPQTGLAESNKLVRGKASNKIAGKPQTLGTETKTKNTAKTSATIPGTPVAAVEVDKSPILTGAEITALKRDLQSLGVAPAAKAEALATESPELCRAWLTYLKDHPKLGAGYLIKRVAEGEFPTNYVAPVAPVVIDPEMKAEVDAYWGTLTKPQKDAFKDDWLLRWKAEYPFDPFTAAKIEHLDKWLRELQDPKTRQWMATLKE